MFTARCRLAAARTLPTASRRLFSAGGNNQSGGGGGSFLLAAAAAAGAGYVYYDTDLKQKALQEQLGQLQIDVAGKTNQAFVFIKPHACKGKEGKVEELVESAFAKHGISITGSGRMDARTIDEKQHIDTHYGAIASKAVLLFPNQLVVPEKGQEQFKAMFGESWQSAVSAGKVYNAKDGAAKLGIDGAALNDKWSKLKRGTNLIKFGGGFYCGQVAKDVYIINGFYMEMRNAYTAPGERIQWYTVEWPVDQLSWADFRANVLGATDPKTAPKDSIRRQILDQYRCLGLKTKPNTGDNGVHASASPLEALAERANWLGVPMDQDLYGRALLAKPGMTKEVLQAWSGDCQVSVEGETAPGKTMSVFDTLEDLDANVILRKVDQIGK